MMRRSLRSAMRIAVVTTAIASVGYGVDRVSAATEANAPHLDTVLRQMDAASKTFKSAQASMRNDVFTKVVNDTDHQTGTIYFLRKNGATQMGLKMTSQPPQVVEYKDGKVRIFNPASNHIDEISASGNNKSRAETFLTLGFGGSGRDLESAWNIQDEGTEPVSDGDKMISTERLDLVPKDEGSKKNLSRVTLWVDPMRDVSLKQVLYFPSGDTRTEYYSHIVLNKDIDMKQFAIQCKGKCS